MSRRCEGASPAGCRSRSGVRTFGQGSRRTRVPVRRIQSRCLRHAFGPRVRPHDWARTLPSPNRAGVSAAWSNPRFSTSGAILARLRLRGFGGCVLGRHRRGDVPGGPVRFGRLLVRAPPCADVCRRVSARRQVPSVVVRHVAPSTCRSTARRGGNPWWNRLTGPLPDVFEISGRDAPRSSGGRMIAASNQRWRSSS